MFDVALASIASTVAWPVLLVDGLAMKQSLKGYALFKQRRYGLNGEGGSTQKFRSMTVCEDGAEVTQATPQDVLSYAASGASWTRTSLNE